MIILGIDPAIGAGKPFAIVKLRDYRLLSHGPTDKLSGTTWMRTLYIRSVLRSEIELTPPDLICVEDSKTGNVSGFPLRAIVQYVEDWADMWGIPCQRVNPQTIKAAYAVGAKGALEQKAEIARSMHLMLHDIDKLPRGTDWTDACAIALCGAALWERAK